METKLKGTIWSLMFRVLALSLVFNGMQPVFAFAQAPAQHVSAPTYQQQQQILLSAPVEKKSGQVELQNSYKQNQNTNFVQVTYKLNQELDLAAADLAVVKANAQNNLGVGQVKVATLMPIKNNFAVTNFSFLPAAQAQTPVISQNRFEPLSATAAAQTEVLALIVLGAAVLLSQIKNVSLTQFEVLRC